MRISAKPSTDPGSYPFHHTMRARFVETDAMGVVHHSAYLPYLEEARLAYMRSLGQSYAAMHDAGVDFAVVESWVGYRSPIRFDDPVDIAMGVASRSRALFEIVYCLTVEGRRVATAVTLHACVDATGRPQRLPAWIDDLAL